ncbi:MAG: hypothetical protein FJ004_04150 [Chloroflexi bacterium]|nr:hypothetical protein [Chloroflexota bacterium]
MSKKNPRGAPRGNQNARRHGFYSKVLDEAQQMDFELAEDVHGIDDEIALLRVKIKALIEKDPENLQLIMQASGTLARLLRTRYTLEKGQGKGIKDAIQNVLTEIAVPLGVAAIAKKL